MTTYPGASFLILEVEQAVANANLAGFGWTKKKKNEISAVAASTSTSIQQKYRLRGTFSKRKTEVKSDEFLETNSP